MKQQRRQQLKQKSKKPRTFGSDGNTTQTSGCNLFFFLNLLLCKTFETFERARAELVVKRGNISKRFQAGSR